MVLVMVTKLQKPISNIKPDHIYSRLLKLVLTGGENCVSVDKPRILNPFQLDFEITYSQLAVNLENKMVSCDKNSYFKVSAYHPK
jgi:hypothetical protein